MAIAKVTFISLTSRLLLIVSFLLDLFSVSYLSPSCLDAFHINVEEEDMYDAIRLAGDRLFDFHVADNNRYAAGLGHLDWPKIIGTLKVIGYDGALSNEFVAPVDRTPAAQYPEIVERNPVDIDPEQLKFIQDHGSSLLTEEFYSDQMRITAETILPLIK